MAENKTNIGLQFFKGVYGKAAALAKSNETTGAIVFDETTKNIYVDGKIYGGASDVNFANGILTLTYTDGRETQVLDFNDTASATNVYHVFERIDRLIGENVSLDSSDGTLNYTDTSYLSEETTLVGADRALDAQIQAINDEIDEMDVEETTVQGNKPEGEGAATGNIKLTYSEDDGIVNISKIEESYATVNATEYVDGKDEGATKTPSTFTVTEGDSEKLVRAKDLSSLKTYTDGQVAQLRDEVNSQVDALYAADYEQATYDGTGNIVIKGIQENNGLISATDDDEKNLTINVNHEYSKTDAGGTDTNTDLATVKTVRGAIDSLDMGPETVDGKKGTGENAAAGNVHVTYSETDGIVSIDSIVEDYTTVTVNPGTATDDTDHKTTTLTVADGSKIATGVDIKTVADFANTRIGEEIAKLDVGSQVLFTYGKKTVEVEGEDTQVEDRTHIVITTGISETDGKIAVAGAENLYFKSAVTEGNRLVTEAEIENMLGALVYRGTITKVDDLPTDVKNGDVYVAANAFNGGETYGSIEAGDMFIYTKGTEEGATGKWQVISGENQVTNVAATITAGAAEKTTIATVDGTDITVGVHVTAGSATIATVTGDVVTIKAGVKQGENTGTLAQGDGADITLAKVAHTGKAEDVSVEDTEGVIEATNVEGALVEIAKEIDEMDAEFSTTGGENGGDNRAKDTKANVAISLEEKDGVVTSLGVDVQYAGITYNEGVKKTEATAEKSMVDSTLVVADGDANKLVIGSDITNLVSFTEHRIAEEIDKLDATVATEAAPTEGTKQTNTVRVQVTEENGKLTNVAASVLGADVSYTPANEINDATLSATNDKGAVLGSDVTAIKDYIDAKAAANKVGVTNNTVDAEGKVSKTENDDAIVIDKTENTVTGKTEYNVRIVWSEWSSQPTE